jgi:hypothetical protein
MPETAPPEILAMISENYEWWNGGEPELMLDSYVEEGELELDPVGQGRAGRRLLILADRAAAPDA